MDLSVLLTTPHELRGDAHRLDVAAERVEAVRRRLHQQHETVRWTGRAAREVAVQERQLLTRLQHVAGAMRREASALRRLADDLERALRAFREAARRVRDWFEATFAHALHDPAGFIRAVGSAVVAVGHRLIDGLLSILPGGDGPDGADLVREMRASWRWHDRNLPHSSLDSTYADVIGYARLKGYAG